MNPAAMAITGLHQLHKLTIIHGFDYSKRKPTENFVCKGDSITLSYFVRLSSGVSSERAKAVCSSWVCTGSAQVFCTSERLISLQMKKKNQNNKELLILYVIMIRRP